MSYIITIAGMSGSGKDYTGALLARQRKEFVHIKPTMKDIAREQGFTNVMEFQQTIQDVIDGKNKLPAYQNYKNVDHMFDNYLYTLVEHEIMKGRSVVVTTWLGPWILEKIAHKKNKPLKVDLKVWLEASLETRVKNIMNSKKRKDIISNYEEAKIYVMGKDYSNIKRYKAIYNIDITDHTGFDIVIDSSKYVDEARVNLILEKFDAKIKLKPNKAR